MNQLLYLSDDELQSQLATKYNLLVHIGQKAFEYAVVDTVRDEVKVIAEWEWSADGNINNIVANIKALPESSREFKFAFNKVKISVDTVHYSLVPAELFSENTLEEYRRYLKLANTSELLINDISSTEIKNVTAIESELIAELNAIFQRPRIFSSSTTFIQSIYKTLRGSTDTVCFIDIRNNHFHIGVVKNLKLAFYNSFKYFNDEEFNYYLLSVISSLDFNADGIKAIVSGRIVPTDSIYLVINKYFDNILFGDGNGVVNYPERFQAVQPSTYLSLINLDLCE